MVKDTIIQKEKPLSKANNYPKNKTLMLIIKILFFSLSKRRLGDTTYKKQIRSVLILTQQRSIVALMILVVAKRKKRGSFSLPT